MGDGMSALVMREDERPARRDGTCFYCGEVIGSAHAESCVVMSCRRFVATPAYEWQPVSNTAFIGHHAVFWWDDDEKARFESATAYIDDGVWSFWTRGGPNGGDDWDEETPPVKWMRIEDPKD